MLKKKAKFNYKVAECAEKNEYYDAAVSRYYYYIFQNVLAFLKAKGKITNFKGKGNKHRLTINELLKYCKEKNLYNDNPELTKLWMLSSQRNSSDYKNRILKTNKEFTEIFKNHFDELEKALKRISVVE